MQKGPLHVAAALGLQRTHFARRWRRFCLFTFCLSRKIFRIITLTKQTASEVLRYRVTGRVLSRPTEMVAAGVCAFRRGIPDVAGLVDVDGEVIPSLVREVFCPMWRERAKTPHAQVRSSASVSA